VLRAADVTFSYGRGQRVVLDGVSVTADRGTIVGLLGPNGSGKTTLLRVLGGLAAPVSGHVELEGRPLAAFARRDLARRIALVPQETQAAFDFTAIEMVLMGRYPHLGPFALEGPDDVRIAREALAATGTLAFENRRFGTLSGGEKQRVVIASALAQSSDLLLLDEPTASLDLRYQLEIMTLLRELNARQRATLVLCTHDLNLAAAVCDQIVLLKDGRVAARGVTSDTITAANIRDVYGVDADVSAHVRAGHLTVVPLGRLS
jgi:iron complex transport system ATP-binding protein